MTNRILHELKEHLPFTAVATLIAMAIVALGFLINKTSFISYTTSLFYIFHPAHIFFASIVSSAIYFRYKKNILAAIAVGFIISIVIGSISDVIFPYLGGIIFGLETSFHLPILEIPWLIILVSLSGCSLAILGFTKIPHFLHVFLSVFASLLYILAFSIPLNFLSLIIVFIITFISVVVPCCLGDIVFPLMFQKSRRKNKK